MINREFVSMIEHLLIAIKEEDELLVSGEYTKILFYLSEGYYGIDEFLSQSDKKYCDECIENYPVFKRALIKGGIISDED